MEYIIIFVVGLMASFMTQAHLNGKITNGCFSKKEIIVNGNIFKCEFIKEHK